MRIPLKKAAFALAFALCLPACVKVDQRLGQDLIDKSLLYDTYTAEFDLNDIRMAKTSDLSGYSDVRITLGAIRDDTFGLTTRSSAFTLIPALDTLDLGVNPEPVKFDLHFAADTVSVASEDQMHILQNVHVYALTDTLSRAFAGINKPVPHSDKSITRGVPVLNGRDSLTFEFTPEFAQTYIDAIQKLGGGDHILKSYEDYTVALPGIYLETDVPSGNGGRINLFHLSCLSVNSSGYYTRNNNIALLTVRSTYDGVRKDTTFLFIPGEPMFYDEAAYIKEQTKFSQFALNICSHETEEGPAREHLFIEGGGGLKPVISSREMREGTLKAIQAQGGDPRDAVINKATILMPLEPVDDFSKLDFYPSILSPTIRRTYENGSSSFAGLTDASASSENQGNLDRSNLTYAPDITYHLQEILLNEEAGDEHDVWFLNLHTETQEEANGAAYDEYYQQMMYANYYNYLYGGGYGYGGYGYGGYGYGGYGYNGYGGYNNYYNYYNYAMLMSAMAGSATSTTTSQELDRDRYYCGILAGPDSQGARPSFRVTFSLPKDR